MKQPWRGVGARKSIRILLTGAGAPGTSGTLHMLKKGADQEELDLQIIGSDREASVRVVPGLASVVTVPNPCEPNYLAELNRVILSDQIDLVIPQTTAENAFLANHSNDVRTLVLCPTHRQVALLNDKRNLLEAFVAAGLPHPKFQFSNSAETLDASLAALGFPASAVVVKPRASNGMRGVRRISADTVSFAKFMNDKPDNWSMTRDELFRVLESASKWPELVVMEFLEGQEYSVDVFSSQNVQSIIPRRRDEMRAGISVRTTLDFQTEIVDIIEQLISFHKLEGLFGLQFIMTQSGPMVLESNPRVQGSMVASLMSGVNVLWLAVKRSLGIEISAEEAAVRRPGGVFTRGWGGTLEYADGSREVI